MQETSQHRAAVNPSGGDRIPWGWVAATAVALEVVLVASAFAWVAVYSYLIHPGEELAYYQSYAESASPVVAVVMGIPYWYLACRWVGRKAGSRALAMSLWIWFILFAIDLPLTIIGGAKGYILLMVAISHSTKLLAAYLGGRAALENRP